MLPVPYGPGAGVFDDADVGVAGGDRVPAVDVLGVVGSVDVVVALAVLLSVPSGALADTFATMVNVTVAPEAMAGGIGAGDGAVRADRRIGAIEREAGVLGRGDECRVRRQRIGERDARGRIRPLFVSEML